MENDHPFKGFPGSGRRCPGDSDDRACHNLQRQADPAAGLIPCSASASGGVGLKHISDLNALCRTNEKHSYFCLDLLQLLYELSAAAW